jgi:hypothetical protein
MNGEELIVRLLDMQMFVKNNRLQPLLDQVGIKYGLTGDPRELSDEELEVFAAGDPALYELCKRKKHRPKRRI